MSVTITEAATPITEDDITYAEQRMGQTIPVEYRAFLLMHNGGRPWPDGFRTYNASGEVEGGGYVTCFFGINMGRYYSDLEENLAILHSRMPPNLLPIASDPGGNRICLSTDGSDVGTVYFWHHGFETQPPTYDNVWFVACSFNEFIKDLQDLHEIDEEE